MEIFLGFLPLSAYKTFYKSTYLISLDENITIESKQKGEQFIEAKY